MVDSAAAGGYRAGVAATRVRPMRTFLACALLALVPFTSVRMVCFDAHAAANATAAADAADEAIRQAERECERVCKRHAAPQPPPPVSCALIPDPSCSFLTAGAVAVMPREPLAPAPAAWRPFDVTPAPDYRSPILPLHAPPPRG
jgi:hypothetical protein